ncbi:hypothetical protein JCM17960_15930 [Magnetospira thiophila]
MQTSFPTPLPPLALIAGCVVFFTAGCIQATQFAEKSRGNKEIEAQCEAAMGQANLSVLDGKMAYRHDEIPTREMLLITDSPTQDEVDAVQRLQQVKETCKKMREDAGYTTSATEDLMESRRAKLRYGLFKGEIPFGVYNYGVAQVLRKQSSFQASADESFEAGRKAGQQKAMAEFSNMNNQMRYNSYMNTPKTWNCYASVGGSSYTCY